MLTAVKNGNNITVYGPFEDLEYLYYMIHHFVIDCEAENPIDFTLLCFAYDVRKTYEWAHLKTKGYPDIDGKRYPVYGFALLKNKLEEYVNCLKERMEYQLSNKLQQSILLNLEYIIS